MNNNPPPSVKSLDARLRNLARSQGIPERRMRRLISLVVLGQHLARTQSVAIKGASNIEVRLGTKSTRVSSDLDTVCREGVEQFRDDLSHALRQGWSGFTGVVIDDGRIPTPAPDGYRPHRFRVKLQFHERPFSTVTVEMAMEEVDSLQENETVEVNSAAEWLHELGLPHPGPVRAMPLAHQIAQKLHACTAPDDATWTNDRAHDLVDLQLAERIYEGTNNELRQVAERLFSARKLHSWPPKITARNGWRERYLAESEGLDVLKSLDSAIEWANHFVAEIAHSKN